MAILQFSVSRNLRKRKWMLTVLASAALFGLVALGVFLLRLNEASQVHPVEMTGAVVTRDPDPRARTPIADVLVTATAGKLIASTRSNAAGYFHVVLQPGIRSGETVHLRFEHPDLQTVQMEEEPDGRLYVVRMGLARPGAKGSGTAVANDEQPIVLSDVRVRYSAKEKTTISVGSLAKQFDVINVANVPCRGRQPCSPDGRWKAAVMDLPLDAQAGNEFHNLRVSCIAGPCPFTRIDPNHLEQAQQHVTVKVLNWSDTTSFLVEAEVLRATASEFVRYSFPFITEQSMTFVLPAATEGVSIQAELNGEQILFPLGPNLILSWANCSLETPPGGNRIYRCELKPPYQFQ